MRNKPEISFAAVVFERRGQTDPRGCFSIARDGLRLRRAEGAAECGTHAAAQLFVPALKPKARLLCLRGPRSKTREFVASKLEGFSALDASSSRVEESGSDVGFEQVLVVLRAGNIEEGGPGEHGGELLRQDAECQDGLARFSKNPAF